MDIIKWLPGYTSRIRVVCNVGEIQKLVLHKGSGPEKTIHDIFLDGRCADLSKLVFTQSDGVTPFTDYWIEIIDSESAVVWVKVTEGRPIFIYPGESPAESAAAPAGTENSAGRG